MGLGNVRYVRAELSELVTVAQQIQVKEEEVGVEVGEASPSSEFQKSHRDPFWKASDGASAVERASRRCDGEGPDEAISMLSRMTLGVALHACGPATDVVHQLCLDRRASFVLSPCCYGFLQHWADGSEGRFAVSFPRSVAFKRSGCTRLWFSALCSCADRTFWSHDSRADAHNAAGMEAMRAVDTDRLMAAKERGYTVCPHIMVPPSASTKNHILVGHPDSKSKKVQF